MQAVGLSFSCVILNSNAQQRFEAALIECAPPAASEVQRVADLLASCFLDLHNLRVVHATCSNSGASVSSDVFVENHHLERIALALNFTANPSKSGNERSKLNLVHLNCADGVATARSFPGAYGRKNFIRATSVASAAVEEEEEKEAAASRLLVAFIMEVKHSTESLVLALAQAFSESTNAALAQARFGVPIDQIRVPICVSNGQLMKFAVTCLLQPAFPYLVILTKTLDISDRRDRAEAARMLVLLTAWLAQPLRFQGPPKSYLSLALSTLQYHLKPLQFFFCVHDSLDMSLQHFLHIMAHLQASDAHSVVVAPLTISTRTPSNNAALVFPNLCIDGYRIGMPESEAECDEVLDAVERALGRVHEAGVVHLDFYPSNIMWRRLGSESASCNRASSRFVSPRYLY